MSDTEKRKLSQARVADLRVELEKRGLDKNGVKAVLVERLVSALSTEGLSSTDIDDYIVESGSHEVTKKLPKRGSTPSKTKDEDEMMVDLDNKSEVLDYGENDDLDTNKEENSRDTAENDRESEVNKKDEEIKPAPVVADAVLEEDEFQVLDEEASDIEDTDNKEGQQQDGNVDNEDSIHLTLNEDDEKLLIGEDENGFSTESDAPAAARSRTQVRKKEPAPYKHSASSTTGSSTKKQSPSKEDDKVDKHEDSNSAGDTNSSSSDKKKASSPKGAGTERSRTSVDEKHSVALTQQQQSDQQLEGVNGDKSRSGSSPKESKEKTSESNEKQRESSPSNNTSGRNLWVSGLSSTTRATDLKQTFSKYGKVLGAKVVTNARTPGARCYGFVTMAKREDASRCIQHLDRTELHGRMISVEKAKGEATGPGRVKTPTSPSVGKDHKPTEGSKDNHKKESSSSKSNDSERDQRRESRDKSGKPVRQRITAPSPGPGSERSTSRTAEQPRSEERTTEPFIKKRTHTRSPPPARPPPRRVNHSPGGGLHTRRSANTTVLTFASIKQARDRQRLREREREDREHARRRDEEVRRLERRQREEQIKIEREKEELRLERERIEKARKDILRLEREKAKLERERLEWEREELRRQQQKLREMAERAQAMPSHVPTAVPARNWLPSYSGSSATSAARYGDVRRSSSATGAGTKRHSDHHGSDYFDERAAKRPVPTGGDERRSFDSTTTAPPPPRFSTSSSSTAVKRTDNRRDIDFSHRSSGNSLFARSSAGGPVSASVSYDRSSSSGRRDAYFPNSSTSSSAGRVVEPTRREPDPQRGAKDDRFRESYRPSVRSNERPMSGRDVSGLDSRSGQLTGGSGLSGSSASSRPRDRYPEPVGRGISASTVSREPWLGSKNDSSSSNNWSTRTSVNTSTDKWMTGNTTMPPTGRTNIFNSSVSGMGLGISSMTTGTSNPFNSADRYDAYKQPLASIRKY